MRNVAFSSALLGLLLLVGCGGGGNDRDSLSGKARLKAVLSRGLAGISDLHQAGGAGRAKKRAPSRDPGDAYFDEDLQLWVDSYAEPDDANGVHVWGDRYFEDEALTKPAGGAQWTSNWTVWPNTDDLSQTVTAGPHKGSRMEEHDMLNEDGGGRSTGSGHDPAEGGTEWTMTWDESGLATNTQKFTRLDGSWIQYVGGPTGLEEGTRFVLTTSEGYTITLDFDLMGAGAGTMTGNDPYLPATLEWNDQQVGTIRWADGTTSAFEGFGF